MQLQDVDGGQEQASAKEHVEGRQAATSSQVCFATNKAMMPVLLQFGNQPEQALFALPQDRH